MFKIAARLLAFTGALLAALLTLLWLAQRRMMYFPSGDVPPPARVGLSKAEIVTFATDDGLTLNGWFVPGDASNAGTVIVFNGNAGNRAYRSDLGARLAASGLAVLLFDYRGYGENAGSPTEEGLALDARAARSYVLSRGDVDGRRLVYFGESLGSAVAVRLAVEHPPHAVILRSPFTSFVDLGRLHYPMAARRLDPARPVSVDSIASSESLPAARYCRLSRRHRPCVPEPPSFRGRTRTETARDH